MRFLIPSFPLNKVDVVSVLKKCSNHRALHKEYITKQLEHRWLLYYLPLNLVFCELTVLESSVSVRESEGPDSANKTHGGGTDVHFEPSEVCPEHVELERTEHTHVEHHAVDVLLVPGQEVQAGEGHHEHRKHVQNHVPIHVDLHEDSQADGKQVSGCRSINAEVHDPPDGG